MRQHRIDSPAEISASDIAARIASGTRVIVQYSRVGYEQRQLVLLNELVKLHGRDLEIRFYGHYSQEFDASVLQHIPDAQSVSIDCLTKARNLGALSHLHNLKELNLGVFEMKEADILTACTLSSLETLVLGDTKNCRIDLAPLASCGRLYSFHTTGHTKNISTISNLSSLRGLSLSSIKRREDLEFVSNVPNLNSLRLILGGRTSIAQITAPQLNVLEIIRVQGLEDLGDLGRFEELESVLIEDQIKIREIKMGPNQKLRNIVIINCKALTHISGIEDLDSLANMRISRTAINYEDFTANRLPPGLKIFAFYTGKSRLNSEIKADLSARGFREFPWAAEAQPNRSN